MMQKACYDTGASCGSALNKRPSPVPSMGARSLSGSQRLGPDAEKAFVYPLGTRERTRPLQQRWQQGGPGLEWHGWEWERLQARRTHDDHGPW